MARRAVVTGGSGRAGEYICCELLAHGWEVCNADRVPPGQGSKGGTRAVGAEYREVDMEDLGQVASVTAGADAIIHMAAYPSPQPPPENVVFQTNVMATCAQQQPPCPRHPTHPTTTTWLPQGMCWRRRR